MLTLGRNRARRLCCETEGCGLLAERGFDGDVFWDISYACSASDVGMWD
jgi:hypothetical protein